ncbi:hypothetical protein [Pediococcus pentosaceus]|uniref:hypothetical protein n=1 Tax=Pediococcus pentosaceus TaxID=1255 RepID=UPI003C2CFA49
MKIAVIGNGIVGATFVNEILERFPAYQIVQFDGIKGTATTASAGIIAPWLSKRRNKKWYNLARQGGGIYVPNSRKIPNASSSLF